MSADGFFATSAPELVDAVLSALRSDETIQSVLGNPVRLFDDETRQPNYPYAVLERHESTDSSSSNHLSLEHQLQFATYSRHGGLREAKAILGILKHAVEHLSLSLTHQRIVLTIPTYSDVMRTQNQTVFRGLLRVRIHTEEI